MSEGLVIASNRGPVSWSRDDSGELIPSRGFGGLVTAIGGALQREPGTWVSVALSEDDSEVAAQHKGSPFQVEADGSEFTLRLLDAGERFDTYYNDVANRLLWFTVHGLWGEPYGPTGIWSEAWNDAYLPVNEQVARAVIDSADADDELYLQDYHLTVAPRTVREALPGAPLLHYLHTPWAQPDYLRRLPDPVAEQVLHGLLAADVVAFSSPLWCEAFRRCAVERLGATRDGDAVNFNGRRTVVADFVLGVDEEDLSSSAASDAAQQAGRDLDDELDGRRLVLRVDRSDLSKNILRGLRAYELLLERHPEHIDRVWHYAHLNPSRQDVPDYREYLETCVETGERIRERFGEQTVTVTVTDDYPRAVAALQRFDVLIANPVVDGTNLVAKEGPVLNQRDGALVLSNTAGAAASLAEGALFVNPYDVEEQAEALHRALQMDDGERRDRAESLRSQARHGAPDDWFAQQREVLREAVRNR